MRGGWHATPHESRRRRRAVAVCLHAPRRLLRLLRRRRRRRRRSRRLVPVAARHRRVLPVLARRRLRAAALEPAAAQRHLPELLQVLVVLVGVVVGRRAAVGPHEPAVPRPHALVQIVQGYVAFQGPDNLRGSGSKSR